MNTMNAAVGSMSAIVTGAIVDATGSFAVAFVVAAAVLLAGVCFYALADGSHRAGAGPSGAWRPPVRRASSRITKGKPK